MQINGFLEYPSDGTGCSFASFACWPLEAVDMFVVPVVVIMGGIFCELEINAL